MFCWIFFLLMSVCLNLNDNYHNTDTFNCNLQLFLCVISIAEDPMLHSQVCFWQDAVLAFWLLE